MSLESLQEDHAGLAAVDFQSMAFLNDPYPTFRLLREHEPVYWSDMLKGWVLTSFEEVKQGMDMSVDFVRPFTDRYRARNGDVPEIVDLGELVGGWMSFFDVPAHGRLRNLLNQVVNRNSVEAVRPYIAQVARDLVDGMRDAPVVDIASNFSNLLPVLVIGEMLGIRSQQDCRQLMAWSDELHLFVGQSSRSSGKYTRAGAAAREMDTFFRDEIAERKRRPRDDGITRMIQAREGEDRLNDAELAANCVMLFYAGHETTAGQISLALMALARHQDQLRRLQRDASLMPNACEEFLRYDGPVQAMVRVASTDARMRGKHIRAGDRIYPFINAANRDPEFFAEPDALDIGRQDNKHIVFGHGVHFCIGSWLARAEVPIALDAILGQLSGLEMPGGEVVMRDSLAFRAPQTLNMKLHWAR